jgi:hypothetical protein
VVLVLELGAGPTTASAPELSEFLSLLSMPKTPEPKLNARVPAAQELLVFLAALLLMSKTLQPIKAAQEPPALQVPRQAPQLAELPPALQVSYPRPAGAVQEPLLHPPSRWLVQDPTVHTALKVPHRRHPRN